jgi:hypothetical protein
MPGYRIYTVGSDGRCIVGEDIESDQEAIKKAAQAAKGSGIELWERGRCVVRLLPVPSPKWSLPSIGSAPNEMPIRVAFRRKGKLGAK